MIKHITHSEQGKDGSPNRDNVHSNNLTFPSVVNAASTPTRPQNCRPRYAVLGGLQYLVSLISIRRTKFSEQKKDRKVNFGRDRLWCSYPCEGQMRIFYCCTTSVPRNLHFIFWERCQHDPSWWSYRIRSAFERQSVGSQCWKSSVQPMLKSCVW